MNILIEIGLGAAKLALGLFAFFCMIGVAGWIRDAARGQVQTWMRREACYSFRELERERSKRAGQ